MTNNSIVCIVSEAYWNLQPFHLFPDVHRVDLQRCPKIKSHKKTTADAGNHRPIERNRILSNQRECGEKGESSALKVRENEDGEKNMAPLTTRSSQSATTEQIPGSQESCDGSQHGESVWKGGYSIQAMVGTWLTLAIISVFLLFLSLLGVFRRRQLWACWYSSCGAWRSWFSDGEAWEQNMN